jgi:hypothetical protein
MSLLCLFGFHEDPVRERPTDRHGRIRHYAFDWRCPRCWRVIGQSLYEPRISFTPAPVMRQDHVADPLTSNLATATSSTAGEGHPLGLAVVAGARSKFSWVLDDLAAAATPGAPGSKVA